MPSFIAKTLSRDDITAMLGTMDPDRAAQVQEVVGLAGGMESAFGARCTTTSGWIAN